jgi:hypothetical protein
VTKKKKKTANLDDAELERRIRAERKFSIAEAVARNAGDDLLKGASPVTRKRQAELELEEYLEKHLVDAERALETVLLRKVSSSEMLLKQEYENPIAALMLYVERVLTSEARLQDFVRQVDVEWGRITDERPHFQKAGGEPDPNDPYSFSSVRNTLSQLVDQYHRERPPE